MAEQKSGTLRQGAATDAQQKPVTVFSLELSSIATQQTDRFSDMFQAVWGWCSSLFSVYAEYVVLLIFSLPLSYFSGVQNSTKKPQQLLTMLGFLNSPQLLKNTFPTHLTVHCTTTGHCIFQIFPQAYTINIHLIFPIPSFQDKLSHLCKSEERESIATHMSFKSDTQSDERGFIF